MQVSARISGLQSKEQIKAYEGGLYQKSLIVGTSGNSPSDSRSHISTHREINRSGMKRI